jgi:hypothetical protein
VALVASSEHSVLTVARAIAVPAGQHAFESVEPILRDKRKLPDKMGPTSMDLLKETLSRGVVLQLLHRGGWRNVRHLRKGIPKAGRLWDRAQPPKLPFTGASVKLLRWLVAEPLGQRSCGALEIGAKEPLGLGDELLLYLTLDMLAGTDCGETLGAQAVVRRSPLLWLGFPELAAPKPGDVTPDRLKILVEEPYSILVEALQPDLGRRWEAVERSKQLIDRLAVMRELGETQAKLLDVFYGACDKANRRDLAGFALDAARRLFGEAALPGSKWTGSLDKSAALSERSAAHKAAGAYLRSLQRWRDWDNEHRGVRFIDDEYQAAQLLLSMYEQAGPALERAGEVARSLESLGTFQQGAQS